MEGSRDETRKPYSRKRGGVVKGQDSRSRMHDAHPYPCARATAVVRDVVRRSVRRPPLGELVFKYVRA